MANANETTYLHRLHLQKLKKTKDVKKKNH